MRSSTFYPSPIPWCLCGLDEFSRLLTFPKGEKVISSNVRNQGDAVAICQGSDCELKDSKFMKTYTWCMRWLGGWWAVSQQ